MGLFSQKSKSLLPPNPAAVLAEWGRAFPPPGVPQGDTSETTDRFVHSLVSLEPEAMSKVVSEIREIGLREGGWTAYGAWELLNMTYTRDVPPEFLEELSEPRVRLIRSLDMPGYPETLCVADTVAWNRVFADEV